jgi:hypothetical protein
MVEVAPASAQIIPSAPSFTLEYVDRVDYVSPFYVVDHHTGEPELIQSGRHLLDQAIVITIKNQPVASGYHVFYDVDYKEHSDFGWTGLQSVSLSHGLDTSFVESTYVSIGTSLNQSDSDYTIVAYALGENCDHRFADLSPNAQLDFKVTTVLGHDSTKFVDDHPLAPIYIGHTEPAIAYDAKSHHNSIKTLTLPTPSPTPMSMSETLKLVAPILGVVIAAVIIAAVFLSIYKRIKPKQIQTELSRWQ